MASSSLLIFFFSILLHLVAHTIAQDTALNNICSKDQGNFTGSSTYQTNLKNLLSSLTSNSKIDSGFFNVSYGRTPNQVNAMGLCRGDVKPDSCRSCISNSTLELPKACPNQKEAVIWYDHCMLRYSNRSFFGNMEFGPSFWMYNLNNVSDAKTFNQAVGSLLDSLKNKAASGDSVIKFATGNTNTPGSETIYALMQCTPDLSKQQCIDCLNNATGKLPQCCDGRKGGRVIAPSCNFRYELDRFYDVTADGPITSPSPSPLPTPSGSQSPSPPPTPTAQPPGSPDQSTPSPPSNSTTQKGTASHSTSAPFVLVLISLLLWQSL